MNELVIAIFSIAAGAFSLVSSLTNWSWFFRNRRAQAFVRIFGHTGARVFYAVLGIFLMALGLYIWLHK